MDITRHIYRYDFRKVNEEYKTHNEVESYVNQEAKKAHAENFISSIWPLIEKEINDEKVSRDEVIAACSSVIDTLNLSAHLFAQDIFQITLIGNEDADDYELPQYPKTELNKVEWWYAELARYLNEHPDYITLKTIQWAEWKWRFEFVSRLGIPSQIESQILQAATPDNILSLPRTLRLLDGNIGVSKLTNTKLSVFDAWDVLRRNSGYLEFPEEITYLLHHYETAHEYDELWVLISGLSNSLLIDSILFHILYPDTYLKLQEYTTDELTLLSLLEHWSRTVMNCHCNMEQLLVYAQDDNNDYDKSLFEKSVREAEKWCNGFRKYQLNGFELFQKKIGNKDLHRWYFDRNWTVVRMENRQYQTERQFRDYVEEFMLDRFSANDIMTDFCNRDYLGFIGYTCAEKKNYGKGDFQQVQIAYRNYLHNEIVSGGLELNEDALNFLRGLSFTITHLGDDFVISTHNLLNEFKVRNEGWGITDDIVKGIAKEVIVISAALLVYENEDKLEKSRQELLDDVISHLVLQSRTCRHDYIQEQYLLPLQIAETILLQLCPKNVERYELELCKSISNIYMLVGVLQYNEKHSQVVIDYLKHRWEQEKEGVEIISRQCRKTVTYNKLNNWFATL